MYITSCKYNSLTVKHYCKKEEIEFEISWNTNTEAMYVYLFFIFF